MSVEPLASVDDLIAGAGVAPMACETPAATGSPASITITITISGLASRAAAPRISGDTGVAPDWPC